MSLHKDFKKAREYSGISIKALSYLSNVQPGRISAFEKNGENITINTLQKILTAINKKLIIAEL